MRFLRFHLFFALITISLLLPNLTRAVITSCSEYEEEVRADLIDECDDADLDDPTDEDYCTRIDLGTGQQLCEFTAGRDRCYIRPGAAGLLCQRGEANDECIGTCPTAAGGLQNAPTPGEPELAGGEVVLPRLQVDIPTLQPFTRPRTYQEGEQVFLNIGFIGQYIVGLYKYLVGIVGILVGVIYTWAGIRWITSAGDPERIGDAKKKIGGATMGLVLVLGSYLVLYLVNPALIVFKPLQIKYVKTELLIIDSPGPATDHAGNPASTYDSIFQQYANCAGLDWRILRMIAYKESGLNPNSTTAGFTGLFQTRPKFCKSALDSRFEQYCTDDGLRNPSVNTAVAAQQLKRSASKLIDQYCSAGDTRTQLTIVYGTLSSGGGGTAAALKYAQQHGGCTVDNLREGFKQFWKSHKDGASARWFYNFWTGRQANYCADFSDPLECMGPKKYDHTLRAADAMISQGITDVRVQPTGPCPLDTENPFPTS